jgi:uncharacterized protein YegJ (DUF2314 family)
MTLCPGRWGMQIIFVTATSLDSSALYGGGAVLFGGASALLFIVALFGKRGKTRPEKLSDVARITGPALAAAREGGVGPARLEAPEESVVQVDEDDPRMAAAVAEAKKRLPEFAATFSKAKDGYQFSVKAPFADPGSEESEFMWVHVCRVDFDAVHGTLLNDPEFVKGLKYDDVVRVPMERIVDWVYNDGEKSVGDFTAKVLDEAAKSAGANPAPYSSEAAQNDSSSNSEGSSS